MVYNLDLLLMSNLRLSPCQKNLLLLNFQLYNGDVALSSTKTFILLIFCIGYPAFSHITCLNILEAFLYISYCSTASVNIHINKEIIFSPGIPKRLPPSFPAGQANQNFMQNQVPSTAPGTSVNTGTSQLQTSQSIQHAGLLMAFCWIVCFSKF